MILAVLAIATLTANAQKTRHDAGTITLQPMFGLTCAGASGTIEVFVPNESTQVKLEDESRFGILGGLEAEYYVNDWFSASAGVAYSQQGWRIKEKVSDTKWDMDLDYINVPVMANFYLFRGFALKVGVQPGFLINAKSDGVKVMDSCEKFGLSIPWGISYEFGNNINIEARWVNPLTKVNKYGDEKVRSNLLQLTVGYKFGL